MGIYPIKRGAKELPGVSQRHTSWKRVLALKQIDWFSVSRLIFFHEVRGKTSSSVPIAQALADLVTLKTIRARKPRNVQKSRASLVDQTPMTYPHAPCMEYLLTCSL